MKDNEPVYLTRKDVREIRDFLREKVEELIYVHGLHYTPQHTWIDVVKERMRTVHNRITSKSHETNKPEELQ